MNIYLIFSMLASRSTSLQASNRTSAFFFMIFIYSPRKYINRHKPEAGKSHSVPVSVYFLDLTLVACSKAKVETH